MAGAPPSSDACEPAKAANVHAANLIRRRPDVIFMPTFLRGNHCPIACGWGRALADGWVRARESGDDVPPLVVPQFILAKPRAIARHESTAASLRWLADALHSASRGEAASVQVMDAFSVDGTREMSAGLRQALSRAVQQQEAFRDVMERETTEALAWLHADPKRKAVLLAGRPYHVDSLGAASPDKAAVEAGFAVLSLSGLGDAINQAEKERRRIEPTHVWKQGKRLVRAALVAAADPQIELVCLESFGCSFDALSIEAAQEVLPPAGKSLLVLPMDDAAQAGGCRVRLRTLAAAHDMGRGTAVRGSTQSGCPVAGAPAPAASAEAPCIRRAHQTPDGVCAVVKSLTASFASGAASSPGAAGASGATYLPANALALPDLCPECLTEAVPYLLGTPDDATVSWDDFSEAFEKQARSALEEAERGAGPLASGAPLLGVMGNPLLVADASLNDHLFAELFLFECATAPPLVLASCARAIWRPNLGAYIPLRE